MVIQMKKEYLSPESIRTFRTERNFSQQELATILNVGVVSVSRWETGETKPSGTAAAVLATLIADDLQKGHMSPVGPLASGYAIYQLLRERFEKD
jgi:DNA-binding transcriptional regulator YiaG